MSFATEFIRQIENNPAYLHVGLMFLVTCGIGFITLFISGGRSIDDNDCFSEKQEKSLNAFNAEQPIKEEFTNYEVEDADEDADNTKHPDMVLVIRTNYEVGSQLIKDNAVIQFVDFYPAKFAILREKDLERYQIIDTYEEELSEIVQPQPIYARRNSL